MSAIARLLAAGMSSSRLGGAAHEVGHGLAYTAAGYRPVELRIVVGWRGDYRYGHTELSGTAAGVPRRKQEAYLVAVLAGHAAHARFDYCYLGMDPAEAWTDAWESALDDHELYGVLCEHFGVAAHLRATSARASRFVGRHARRLDRLTVALARHGRLSGGAL